MAGKVVSRTRHGNSYKDKKEELIGLGFNFNTQAKGMFISPTCINHYFDVLI